MKNSKLRFSEYIYANISRSKSFGKFVLIVDVRVFGVLVSIDIVVSVKILYTHPTALIDP